MSTAQSTTNFDVDQLADALAEKLAAKLNSKSPENADEYLSVNEVAQMLKIGRPQIWKMTKKGILRAYGQGTRMIRYRRSEVEAAMAAL